MNNDSNSRRINKGITRGHEVRFFIDGKPVIGHKGETIAAALINEGILTSKTIDLKPLGVYCNIGICFSCAMTINGIANVRICKAPVSEGCKVESQHFIKAGGHE
jgi:hypothetical protein